ncbi:MAG: VCBS repeat-containing protein [Solirubrobacterales bacterium]|nr:VCBS repeat-containing protein [Solirubrobacterales bacterium]
MDSDGDGLWDMWDTTSNDTDVNKDGRPDVVGFANAGVAVALNTGSGFGDSSLWSKEFGYSAGGWRVDAHPRMLVDVNGDGRPDVVGFANAGVYVALNTGSGFGAARLWTTDFRYGPGGGWRVDRHPRMLVDVNKDGRPDVVGFANAGVAVALNTGSGFGVSSLWSKEFGYSAGGWRVDAHPRMLVDVNGDGRPDVVGFANAGVYVALNTGSGFGAARLWTTDFRYGPGGGWRVDRHPRMLVDVNKDGRPDVVGFANAGVAVALNTGSGFGAASLWSKEFGYSAGGWRVGCRMHVRGFMDRGCVDC